MLHKQLPLSGFTLGGGYSSTPLDKKTTGLRKQPHPLAITQPTLAITQPSLIGPVTSSVSLVHLGVAAQRAARLGAATMARRNGATRP